MRISCQGYYTEFINVNGPGIRVNGKPFDNVYLKKDPRQLKEVTVTATKIKMVLKGDTIVYNADAFQLSNGSMLDALISQLPGVELDDNGQIRVNGKFVSSLLVNGEDFFRGDPSVALNNLPAYMVDKVKVYEKDETSFSGRYKSMKKEDLPLVVDVNLKKQYNIGWIANAEGGYGTDGRYMGRIFGLRFSDNARFALFGNVNNLNDNKTPGGSDRWNPDWLSRGLTETKMGGMEYFLKEKDGRWKLTSNIKLTRDDSDNASESSSVNFMPGGDLFRKGRNNTDGHSFTMATDHQFEYRKNNNLIQLRPHLEYHRGRNSGVSSSATFSADPAERSRGMVLDSLLDADVDYANPNLLNSMISHDNGFVSEWSGQIEANAFMAVPETPDNIFIKAKADFLNRKEQQLSLYSLDYYKTGGKPEVRNPYRRLPLSTYNVEGSVQYGWYPLDNFNLSIKPSYSYGHSYSSSDQLYYQLEQSGESYSGLNSLPSNWSMISNTLDGDNTYYSTLVTDQHKLSADIIFFLGQVLGWTDNKLTNALKFKFMSNVIFDDQHLDYMRNNTLQYKSRHKWSFQPKVGLDADDASVFYTYSTVYPSLLQMVNFYDTGTPLYIRSGNPDLKTGHVHWIRLLRSWYNNKTKNQIYLLINYHAYVNAVAQAATYDRTTGVTLYQPVNVNGNWDIDATFRIIRYLGKQRRCFFTSTTTPVYRNSVDMITGSEDGMPQRSSVRNFTFTEKAKMEYRGGIFTVSGNVGGTWRHATSPRGDFRTINGLDLDYGLTGKVKLPLSVEISTDLTMHTRRGYGDRALNTDDLVWNARLSKSVMNGNLIFALDGFDLLGQLSNVRTVLNSQGRTETWYNTIPRYGLLHVIYRLNKQPKKQKP